MLDPPYATIEDVKARWPDLPAGSEKTVEALLDDASDIIASHLKGVKHEVSDKTLRRVAAQMVIRKMKQDPDLEGVNSMQMGAGPYQQTLSFANSSGDMYLTRLEKQSLGILSGKAFNIDLLAGESND